MNKYTFRIHFGDGKPQEISVKSTSVVNAIAQGEKENPGALGFNLVSVVHPKKPKVATPDYSDLKDKEHPLFSNYLQFCRPCNDELQNKIAQAVSLRWKGLNYKQIGKELNVSRNTVALWFQQYV
jgi:DNA-binding NarL/FixJ family response regulator